MTLDERNTFLRDLDEDTFLHLGDEQVGYVREVDFLGAKHYAVHSANGQPLTIASTEELAIHALTQTELERATLH